MLAAAAARLAPEQGPLVWVDLGGGTGENVVTMTERYLPLERFAAIYIVDLAEPLCEQARLKVESRPGWKGKVHVVHGDATTFVPPPLSPPSRNLGDNDNDGQASLGTVDLVTFSYSLSMIPNFLDAVDRAAALLKPRVGVLGVADFYAAAKRDHPHRAMPWARRFFWQAVFDTGACFFILFYFEASFFSWVRWWWWWFLWPCAEEKKTFSFFSSAAHFSFSFLSSQKKTKSNNKIKTRNRRNKKTAFPSDPKEEQRSITASRGSGRRTAKVRLLFFSFLFFCCYVLIFLSSLFLH